MIPRQKTLGTKRARVTVKLDKAREIVRPLIETGKPIRTRDLQRKHGISHVHFEAAVHAEHAVRGVPVVDWSTAPEPIQQRIKTAIEREKIKLEAAFNERVAQSAREMLEQTMIPTWIHELEQLVWKIRSRKKILPMKVFNRFRFANHPDTFRNVDQAERNELSRLWEELKDVLVGEDENPVTAKYKLPTAVDDLLKMRAAVQAANSARSKAAAKRRSA